jgi:hypothetical protein
MSEHKTLKFGTLVKIKGTETTGRIDGIAYFQHDADQYRIVCHDKASELPVYYWKDFSAVDEVEYDPNRPAE